MCISGFTNQTKWVKCMTIRFWLQTDDFISFNIYVTGGVGNEDKAMVGIIKVKGKDIHLCCSHFF